MDSNIYINFDSQSRGLIHGTNTYEPYVPHNCGILQCACVHVVSMECKHPLPDKQPVHVQATEISNYCLTSKNLDLKLLFDAFYQNIV